ncbi:Cysteine desulfurase [Desulfurispirillum indicum S5]|uniref:cysteine desulfurase n=1 Tax=Desulfurispirillum indicum (strain ATCC BAA-1389 / DSM 22839 / S5) TaxID=653733 RepID=E6W3J3_DESIS|nr:cysteine desulfurase family protein [Desulfurispirillum indicum]ADU65786.1 Cysteine desulfurase [Desulfurispirillum indicum S5]
MNTAPAIYLDAMATTPCDPRVVEAMLPYFHEQFANASSTVHAPGQCAYDAVASARRTIASCLGAQAEEILFTSGATESNNMAILGAARANTGSRRTILTSAVEHRSVLEPCQMLVSQGYTLKTIGVDNQGRLKHDELQQALGDDVLLTSIQMANNETGVLQDIATISRLAKAAGALVHVDAAQTAGKIPINLQALDVDYLSLSAHKFYGPKGIGALFVRREAAAHLGPIMGGGTQERRLRPGTLNVPGIIGMARACELALADMQNEGKRIGTLRNLLENLLMEKIPELITNGDRARRLPCCTSIRFAHTDAAGLMLQVPHVAMSAGAACSSGSSEPSHVLLAMGLDTDEASRSLRLSLGRFTTEEDIRSAAEAIAEGYEMMSLLTGVGA